MLFLPAGYPVDGVGDQAATVTPATAYVDAILAKPFRLDALLQMVAQFARG
jgi:hypothetical protein